ncbi:MAG: HD domain-containing protein [Gammaproteobacteria bacterium]|jgi:putative hydrolase of HD superfamily|nr:HD domain-containing protein [Gammaproteobacteria bacterium]
MTNKHLQDIVNFIMETDKLKAVIRKTRPQGLGRYENSAEHSWQVALAALTLQQYASRPVDINRVLRMLLVHDLGEIDVGDVIVYQANDPAHLAAERKGVARILALLPDQMGDKYLALWDEFEAAETADAQFAKAMDRALPLLHNLYDGGHSWRKHGIQRHQVETVNKPRIIQGCPALWELIEPVLTQAEADGCFDPVE